MLHRPSSSTYFSDHLQQAAQLQPPGRASGLRRCQHDRLDEGAIRGAMRMAQHPAAAPEGLWDALWLAHRQPLGRLTDRRQRHLSALWGPRWNEHGPTVLSGLSAQG